MDVDAGPLPQLWPVAAQHRRDLSATAASNCFSAQGGSCREQVTQARGLPRAPEVSVLPEGGSCSGSLWALVLSATEHIHGCIPGILSCPSLCGTHTCCPGSFRPHTFLFAFLEPIVSRLTGPGPPCGKPLQSSKEKISCWRGLCMGWM